MEFRATFGSDEYQNIGFARTFDETLWATFGTAIRRCRGHVLRADRPAAPPRRSDTPITIAGFDPASVALYRIEWGTTDVKFYIDGALVATHATTFALPMRAGGQRPQRRGRRHRRQAPTGSAWARSPSRAPSPRAYWPPTTPTPCGATSRARAAARRSRRSTGNTPTPDASWSGFQAVGAGGAIQSPSGQYIQYRATLTGAAASIDSASLAYTVDNAAPSAAIGSADVSGTSASVSFSSPDSDIAGFQCSLDGGAFAACASPKAFTGLAAGAHTVVVRPIDKAGNVGPTVSRTFSIASSQSGGGGGGAGGGNSQSPNADKTAPKVTFVAKSLKASKKGAVSFTVGCPATEATCQVTLKLKNGTKTVASKTVTVKGGKTKTITLQLNKAMRQQLKHRSMKLSSVLTATDAAGNKKTTSKKVTLHKS